MEEGTRGRSMWRNAPNRWDSSSSGRSFRELREGWRLVGEDLPGSCHAWTGVDMGLAEVWSACVGELEVRAGN